jgi:hypothetical protein
LSLRIDSSELMALSAKLREVPTEALPEIIKAAFKTAGMAWVGTARGLAPHRTGATANSLTYKIGKFRSGRAWYLVLGADKKQIFLFKGKKHRPSRILHLLDQRRPFMQPAFMRSAAMQRAVVTIDELWDKLIQNIAAGGAVRVARRFQTFGA